LLGGRRRVFGLHGRLRVSVRFAPVRNAPVRFALVRFALVRFAPVRQVSFKI
jgi:hypothetical protein